jgi:hypothetical protein
MKVSFHLHSNLASSWELNSLLHHPPPAVFDVLWLPGLQLFLGEMEDVGTSAPLASIGALVFAVVLSIIPTVAITQMVEAKWWDVFSCIQRKAS